MYNEGLVFRQKVAAGYSLPFKLYPEGFWLHLWQGGKLEYLLNNLQASGNLQTIVPMAMKSKTYFCLFSRDPGT